MEIEKTLQQLQEEAELKQSHIGSLITAYTEGKQTDLEKDSLEIVDGLIKSWNFAYIPQPTIAELLALKPIVEQKTSQEQINKEALAYLAETDFYVIRMMDVGIPMPEGMQVLRQQARDRIVRS